MSAPGSTTATARGRRLLIALCAVLAGGALALWGSGQLTWFTGVVSTPARGDVAVSATGAQVQPALTGVALLAVAAVAASVAVSGVARRVLGLIVALAGLAAGGAALATVMAAPSTDRLAALSGVTVGAGGSVTQPPAEVTHTTAAPWLALLGAVLVLVAGVVLIVRAGRLPRLGSRYSAPGARRPVVDPERAAWQELDAGRDPTVDPGDGIGAGGPAGRAGPDDEPPTRAV
ncbi:Trp biosynthesis-associated membrane protein [Pseudonocardia asaccharolytica]|uniref:Tryptophan-associated transmembrane protein n=1 Tax=Pseudonocardia asaccharolytica DSM 44247 = NBRC 16224 TaxID=1123024 RepID=A0A511D698_9PSEU|nr:Trp biosynthesis-associated membrane protein [Pseudonocardia asaccharolytica]GEL20305.1 hypothetical protein PA7_41420 [Pseudonocardia asaccharolytica DSM 44247 = NBRC 16224]